MHYFSLAIMIMMSLAAAGYGAFSMAEGKIYTAAGTIAKDTQPLGFYFTTGLCFVLSIVPLIFIFT
ncbi:hypothetical protein [Sphingobium sp. CAP-1]|uniref:hypothetical protein n=1 Tax=Sphingobium sp. CAP-1 TaxID=2676077 RepID=UPI0012BB302B|nr:hypothetical protein [Sphingobium sp. CAP-1]QGP78952.1 hypothetical protein GL174_08070 [Sphingobium sp. CAP-1]